MNLEQHLYNFRRGIKDMQYPEILAIDYLNQASMDISKRQKLLKQFEGERTFSAVAHQARYSLPATHAFRPVAVRFDNEALHGVDKTDLEGLASTDRFSLGTPAQFCLWDDHLEIWPLPSDAADSTTLGADLTAAGTTITLASVDGFEAQGRALIDSEVVSWTEVDGTNLLLKGCERGLEGTVATTHQSGATVTERNLELFCGLYPKKFLTRPSRTATATAAANGAGVTDGLHTVAMSYFSTKWQSESLATEIDDVTTTGRQQINLASIPASDDADVDFIRIYMSMVTGTVLYFVKEIANRLTSTTVTDVDATILANGAYAKFESNVPYGYRDVINDLAISQWFFDNEQFERSKERKNSAIDKLLAWEFAVEQDMGGGYGSMTD